MQVLNKSEMVDPASFERLGRKMKTTARSEKTDRYMTYMLANQMATAEEPVKTVNHCIKVRNCKL